MNRWYPYNRWYPFDSRAEHWRKQRKSILIIVWAALLNLGIGIWDLATDHWELSIVMFVVTLLAGWTALGVILNAGTWHKPWVPFCEKPDIKRDLDQIRMMEGAIKAHEEQRRAAEAREI